MDPKSVQERLPLLNFITEPRAIDRLSLLRWVWFLALLAVFSPLSAQVGPWLPADTPAGNGRVPNPTPESLDQFGDSVALSDGVLVVGATLDDIAGTADAGSVQILERDPTTGQWLPSDTSLVGGTIPGVVPSPDPPIVGWFGFSVAVRGDLVAVGAIGTDTVGTVDAGSVFLYQRSSSSEPWQVADTTASGGALPGQLPAPVNQPSGRFGSSLALSEDYLAVGMPRANSAGVGETGVVFIYQRQAMSGEWLLVQSIANPDPQAFDLFGTSVSISGSLLAIGAPGDEVLFPNAGRVYLFEVGPATVNWQELQSIPNPEPDTDDLFGFSVSISDDTLAVGVPFDRPGMSALAGSVFLYRREVASGPLQPVDTSGLGGSAPGQIPCPDLITSALFGTSVSISGGVLAVGASGDDPSGNSNAGSVYLFDQNPGAGPWQLSQNLLNPDPLASLRFGSTVTVAGAELAVAAFLDDVGGVDDAGSVYIYERGQTFLRGDCNGDGAANIADAVTLLAYLFSGGGIPGCLDACDGNDDGVNNLADAITILNALFVPGSPPLPDPSPDCGADPTGDSLDCPQPGSCP